MSVWFINSTGPKSQRNGDRLEYENNRKFLGVHKKTIRAGKCARYSLTHFFLNCLECRRGGLRNLSRLLFKAWNHGVFRHFRWKLNFPSCVRFYLFLFWMTANFIFIDMYIWHFDVHRKTLRLVDNWCLINIFKCWILFFNSIISNKVNVV